MVHTRSHASVQKEKCNNKKQQTKAAPVRSPPTPPRLSPRHNKRVQGASPDGPPNELLNTVMKDLVTKVGICCYAFGRYRREHYPEFYFGANCDDWDAGFYSATAGQIARWGQRFSCLACHDLDSLFPTHRLKMPPKKQKKSKNVHVQVQLHLFHSSFRSGLLLLRTKKPATASQLL
jgi:hypothetical protein